MGVREGVDAVALLFRMEEIFKRDVLGARSLAEVVLVERHWIFIT